MPTAPGLQAQRKRRGATPTTLAALAGVGRNTVYRLEAGESGTVEAILKLAAALDVPLGTISPESADLIEPALPTTRPIEAGG